MKRTMAFAATGVFALASVAVIAAVLVTVEGKSLRDGLQPPLTVTARGGSDFSAYNDAQGQAGAAAPLQGHQNSPPSRATEAAPGAPEQPAAQPVQAAAGPPAPTAGPPAPTAATPTVAPHGGVRPAGSPVNCGAATVDFGNDDDPNVVVSTYIAHDTGQWRIKHTLANGTVVDRSLQYAITDYAGPSAQQWRGTLNRNPNITMFGEVRLNSAGQPTYNESLYKDGQMIMHSVALCQYDRPAPGPDTPSPVAQPTAPAMPPTSVTASVSVVNGAQGQPSTFNCGYDRTVGYDADPKRVISTRVAYDHGQWLIRHTLADGTVVDRSLQYTITDSTGPDMLQWRGTLNRNQAITMIGEVKRLKESEQPIYSEWLYEDGQMVMHSEAICQDNKEVSAATAAPSVMDGTRKRIPLRLSAGKLYIVPVLINGRIWRDFMIDTGASDVSIPADVATTLMRAGTITMEDIGSEQNYVLADGGTDKNRQIRIHSLQVGEGDNAVVAQNVVGSVTGPQGSLLLGQSFLRRFRSTTIDNVNSMLIIDGSEPQPSVPTALQPAPAPALVPRPAHPASVQPGPILPPPEPEFRCNPPPVIRGLGAAFAILGGQARDGGPFLNSWQRTCLARYNFAMQQWRAEVLRIQMINEQRGY
jgi:predicted aspartyl protease